MPFKYDNQEYLNEDQLDDKYDFEKFDHHDLEALREIKEHLAPQKERAAAKEKIKQEDVFTLAHSLDFAEQ